MNAIAKQWIERAEYDLETANAMLKTDRYLYVAFMCQQCLEKILKACIVSIGKTPPMIHNLLRLAEEAAIILNMTEKQKLFLADLNPFYIKARYGEYKDALSKICTARSGKDMIVRTKEFVKWLKPEIR